jgi:hypothetical protein
VTTEITTEVYGSPNVTTEVMAGGAPGLSAYQLDVAAGRFVGTEAEWAEWIHGADGAPGPTAVSVDEGNAATLGGDGLIFVPEATGGASNWGDLGGTLSDQTDLQEALDAKADIADLGTAAAADAGEFASAAQGALADSAVQPGDIGTAAAEDATAFASAAQGALADTATQPGDLAAVATTGAYSDLTGKPTLGTASAASTGDFATAAQGALADTAVQPGDLTGKADLASPAFTGNPTAPTASPGDNDGTIATTAFVTAAVAAGGSGGGGSDADVAGYIADGGSDTRAALEDIYAPNPPPVGAVTVGTETGTVSGSNYTSIVWGFSVTAAMLLTQVTITPGANGPVSLVIDAVTVASGTGVAGTPFTFSFSRVYGAGSHSIQFIQPNGPIRHHGAASSPAVYDVNGYGFIATDWTVFAGFEIAAAYTWTVVDTGVTYVSAAPTTGSWARGSVVWNSAPSPSGYVGWVCTTGGAPGTWKAFGVIQA